MEQIDWEQVACNLNILGDYLAVRDIPSLSKEALLERYGIGQADLLILFGGSIPYGCEMAVQAFINGIASRMMIVGGEGHTTPFLRKAIAERYPCIPVQGRTEADMLIGLFRERHGLPENAFLIERQSSNCGENAAFSYALAKEQGISPRTVILMQDSSMQQRMDATFKKEWKGEVAFINYAAYRARVVVKQGQLAFEDEGLWGMWGMQHYITLLLGEIPRLHDTPDGYGPNGKGYIVHVDIPDEAMKAFAFLAAHYSGQIRKPWQGEKG